MTRHSHLGLAVLLALGLLLPLASPAQGQRTQSKKTTSQKKTLKRPSRGSQSNSQTQGAARSQTTKKSTARKPTTRKPTAQNSTTRSPQRGLPTRKPGVSGQTSRKPSPGRTTGSQTTRRTLPGRTLPGRTSSKTTRNSTGNRSGQGNGQRNGQGNGQGGGILNSPVDNNIPPTRENWSTADRLRQRAQQSRVGSSNSSGKRAGSPFRSEDIKQAGQSRSGIFPGERPTTRPSQSGRPTRTGGSLSDALRGRDVNPNSGTRRPPERTPERTPGRTQTTRQPRSLSDVLNRGTKDAGQTRSKRNEGRGKNVILADDEDAPANESSNDLGAASGGNSSLQSSSADGQSGGGDSGDYLPKPDETGNSGQGGGNGNPLGDLLNAAQDAATGASETVGDAFNNAVDSASELAGNVGEQAADAAEAIAEDPAGFAGNLKDAAVRGAQQQTRGGQQVISDGLRWGHDALEDAGIDTPDEFSPKGAVELGLSVGGVVGGPIRERAEDAKEKLNETGRWVGDRLNETGRRVGDQLNETGRQVGEQLNEAGRRVGETAERGVGRARDGLNQAAETARDVINQTGRGGTTPRETGNSNRPREQAEPRVEHRPSRGREGRPGTQSDGGRRPEHQSTTPRDPNRGERGDRVPVDQLPGPLQGDGDRRPRDPGNDDTTPNDTTPNDTAPNETNPNDTTSPPPSDNGPGQHQGDETNDPHDQHDQHDTHQDRRRGRVNIEIYLGGGRWAPGYGQGHYVPAPAAVFEPTPTRQRLRTDLEIVDVRFLDLGQPLDGRPSGPRFRIRVRNHNSRFAAEQAVVELAAGLDLADETSPLVSVQQVIPAIPPRGMADIDIALDPQALALAEDVDGNLIAFSELGVILDPEQQFDDVRPDNNVVVLGVDEIQHADLRLQAVSSRRLSPGSNLVLQGEGFQFEPGVVAVVVNKKAYPLTVTRWSPSRVEARLPSFQVEQPMRGQLVLVRPDKTSTEPLAVVLSPASPAQPATPPAPATR